MQKVDRLYRSMLKIPSTSLSDEDEIKIKLSYRNLYKEAFPIIEKLKDNQLVQDYVPLSTTTLTNRLNLERRISENRYTQYLKYYFTCCLHYCDEVECEKIISLAPHWIKGEFESSLEQWQHNLHKTL